MAKRILIITLLVIFGVSIVFFIDIHSAKSTQIITRKKNRDYELTLFSEQGEEIFSERYPVEPRFKEINKGVIEIALNTGSSSTYVFFFDKKKGKVSDIFFTPILFGDNYIAFMKNEVLVLTDMFEQERLYIEISRDFSKVANPISAVINIALIDANAISLKYYKGSDFDEVSEIITMRKEAF